MDEDVFKLEQHPHSYSSENILGILYTKRNRERQRSMVLLLNWMLQPINNIFSNLALAKSVIVLRDIVFTGAEIEILPFH